MSADTAAAPPTSSPRPTSRRRALGLLGVGGAALLGSLFGRSEAHAGHDATNAFHLGETNTTPANGSTRLNSSPAGPTLALGNSSSNPAALGLQVDGRSGFSTAGSGIIPAGAQSASVSNSAVTADSHISVTLVGDPGPRQVGWVERDPGSGFTVHLSPAAPAKRSELSFTYLIVEPVS